MAVNDPLVTVVCLCYNHARYVEEALQSVFAQTYHRVQLIVVDDASTDQSVDVISRVLAGHPEVMFIPLAKNIGNCCAFNKGLKHAAGSFVIDFAADDVLLPHRIARGVEAFLHDDALVGVQFGDAELIDAAGKSLGRHSDRFPHRLVPQGEVYTEVIERYFINSPTMMIRKEVFDHLNGYDESLAYEDFDFWIRAARHFQFRYLPEVLVKNRKLSGSMSHRQFRPGNVQQQSTYRVCEKILQLNRSARERDALARRIRYEWMKSIQRGDIALAWKYGRLWMRNAQQLVK
jgi:glycosyltransferase involved in cell wall biosynthesis